MKIVATVCVRMGSSRLPGKVMKDVLGRPLLDYLVRRISFSKKIDEVVVATSLNSENDIIENYCRQNEILCFRGSEDDVLSRILQALKWREATVGVEVFGDCPLIDYRLIDEIIDKFVNRIEKLDFLSNDLKTTYPPGMEVEVFKVSALEDADKRTNDSSIREHGTLFIRQNPKLFVIENVIAPTEYYYPELELEVDTIEDYEVFKQIIKHFSKRLDFSLDEILKFASQNSDLFAINKNIPRRWQQFREDNID